MTLLVMKFGGSSLAGLTCMKRVAEVVAAAYAQGYQLVVVVSAAKGETDRLIQSARAITLMPSPREYDALLASAEQVSAALLSILLVAQEIPAVSLNGRQAGIVTNDQFNNAHIDDVDVSYIQSCLKQGQVVVVTGFQGCNQREEITTLGRGGSDMTAVVLAGALCAKECQLYTDVEGVYSADPRNVPQAHCLEAISLLAMQQMSQLGAKVMQSQALDYCYQYKIPLRVLSTFIDGEGTLISDTIESNSGSLLGLACQEQQAQITLCGVGDCQLVAHCLQETMAAAHIDIDFVVNGIAKDAECFDMHFTVHMDDFQRALLLAHEVAQSCNLVGVINESDIAKVSLVGVDLRTHPSIAARALAICEEATIVVKALVSSLSRITLVINRKDLTQAARLLHEALVLPELMGAFCPIERVA